MAGSLIEKGNYYYAKFYVNGKQKWVSTKVPVKGNNKRKAERVMQEIIKEYEGLRLDDENILFLTFMQKWLKSIEATLKPSTWETYDKSVNGKINPYFKSRNYRLKDMKPQDFTEYFVYLSKKGRSDGKGGLCCKTVKNIRGVLSSAFEYAIDCKIIKKNPVERSKMPVFAEDIRREVPQYNAKQVKQLLEYAKDNESHAYIFLLLLLQTGLRKGELFGLKWQDVDWDKKLLTINKNRTGSRQSVTTLVVTPKTDESNRKIPLNETTIQALLSEKKRQKENAEFFGKAYDSNDFIIKNILGKPYVNLSAINRVVNRMTEKAGLPHCTIHGLRHSVASILDDNGVPIQDISVLLGHRSISTTEKIYIKRNHTAKTETIDVLNSAINLD